MITENKTDNFPNVALQASGRYVLLEGGEFNVAKLYAFDGNEKFARLFAASPELLKFAQDFLGAYRSEDGVRLKWFANEAYIVITKALGESPL